MDVTKGKEYRVHGPPGTGKTTYLVHQLRRAVKKYGPYNVLATTFTNAAAEEMSGRAPDLPDSQIGTLHAICFRGTDMVGTEIADTKLNMWNADNPHYALSDGKSPEQRAGVEARTGRSADELWRRYKLLRAKMTPQRQWPQDVVLFGREWETWKKERGFLSFQDMIHFAAEMLPTAPGAPKVLFVDEAQDHTPMQIALLREWAKHCDRLVLCGDPFQTLYSWTGCSPRTFLEPAIPDDQYITLRQSYRLPRKVQKYSQLWLDRLAMHARKPDYKPRDEEGRIGKLRTTWKEPARLIAFIERELERVENVMVLGSCAYMVRQVVTLLRDEGIPFHNPYRRSAAEWNPLNQSARGGTSTLSRFLAFFRMEEAAWGDGAGFWTYADIERFCGLVKSSGGLKYGAKTLLRKMKPEEKRSEADIDFLLAEVFEEGAFNKVFETDVDWLEDNLLKSKQSPMNYILRVYRKRGLRGLLDTPRVIPGTIHSVKGGEADTVVLLPDLSPAGYRQYVTGGEGRDSILRTLYVGLTRAREHLALCDPAGNQYVPWL